MQVLEARGPLSAEPEAEARCRVAIRRCSGPGLTSESSAGCRLPSLGIVGVGALRYFLC